MISARGVSYRARETAVLIDVSFDVAAGECVAMAGEPESARTALLHILATLVRPSSGGLTIAGTNAMDDPLTARARVAFADAVCAAGEGLTVAEYLRWTLQARGRSAAIDNTRRVRDALARSGVASSNRVDQLAAAARASVSLAAALMVRPDVLVIDDRPGALPVDAAIVTCVTAMLARGGAIVVATDRPEMRRALSARELRLEGGRLAFAAAPDVPALHSVVEPV